MAGSGISPGAPFAVAGFVRAGNLFRYCRNGALFCGAGACHLPGLRHLSVRVRCFVNWVMELFAENPEIQLTPIALALESGLAQRPEARRRHSGAARTFRYPVRVTRMQGSAGSARLADKPLSGPAGSWRRKPRRQHDGEDDRGAAEEHPRPRRLMEQQPGEIP